MAATAERRCASVGGSVDCAAPLPPPDRPHGGLLQRVRDAIVGRPLLAPARIAIVAVITSGIVSGAVMSLLAVQPPVPPSPDIKLLRFRDSTPSRRLALVWRRSSAMAGFLQKVAEVLRGIPRPLLTAKPPQPGA